MTRPLLNPDSALGLEVDSDRRLRADVQNSGAPGNALEIRSNGLYVKEFQPVGACVVQYGISGGQSLPVYGNAATPTTSLIVYNTAIVDNAPAMVGAKMWDPTVANTRLTIQRDGRYLVSAHGRFKSAGTYSAFAFFSWISRNGDELDPVAIDHNSVLSPAADPGALASPLGLGTGVGGEVMTGTYMIGPNLVELKTGDFLEVRVVAQAAVAAPANTLNTSTQATIATNNVNFMTQTFAVVQIASV